MSDLFFKLFCEEKITQMWEEINLKNQGLNPKNIHVNFF